MLAKEQFLYFKKLENSLTRPISMLLPRGLESWSCCMVDDRDQRLHNLDSTL